MNHKRVERLMRERGLQGVTRRRSGQLGRSPKPPPLTTHRRKDTRIAAEAHLAM
ncbi:MAG: IS3 family transposase [Actinomycetota bacterium]